MEHDKLMARLLGLDHPDCQIEKDAQEWIQLLMASDDPEPEIDAVVAGRMKNEWQKVAILKLLKSSRPDFVTRIRSKMLPALEALLRYCSSQIEVLDLTGFVSHVGNIEKMDKLQEALGIVQTSSMPRLQSFAVLGEKCEIRDILDVSAFHLIFRPTHLQMLRIEVFAFDMAALLELGKTSMPQLRFLSIRIVPEFALPTKEEMVASFPRLKVFLFRTEATNEVSIALKRLCWSSLPWLQVAQDFASEFCSQLNYNFALHETDASNLRHLSLLLALETVEEGVHLIFPHVTHLKLEGLDFLSDKDEQIKRLLLFTKVENLHVGFFSSQLINRFLESYGPSLLTLSLSGETDVFDGSEIFKLCPRLERLSHYNWRTKPASFFQLKELRVESTTISDVLQAPNLEEAIVYLTNLDCGDVNRIIDKLIPQKLVNAKLKKLTFDLQCKTLRDISKHNFEHVARLMKELGNKVPTLQKMSLKLNNNLDYLPAIRGFNSGMLDKDNMPNMRDFYKDYDDFMKHGYLWFADMNLIDLLSRYY